MQSTTCLLQKLIDNYPQFEFCSSDVFKWSADNKTIYYDNNASEFDVSILHELAHATLGHSDYDKDIQLLKMETEAWDKSIILAKDYGITIDEDSIQLNIDSYRDWLHKRSICTKCQAVGMQTNKDRYRCISCGQSWIVNEAKNCRLKRTNR